MADGAALSVTDLTVSFPAPGGGRLQAVRGATFAVGPGEVLSLVGESGSGKTTAAMAGLALTSGRVRGRVTLFGEDPYALSRRDLRGLRKKAQLVFQDPYSSLNPRLSVGDAVAEPMIVHGLASRAEAGRRAAALLERVGLSATRHPGRRPEEFSGGQRQRVAIARALAAEPELLVLDEPVSALDVSEQARVLNLLADLREERGLAYLFISHDLSVVEHVSDRIAVMYLGEIVETGDAADVLLRPGHPYTQALLAAAPSADPERAAAPRTVRIGEPPSPLDPPTGCSYHPRCPRAEKECGDPGADVAWFSVEFDHRVRCRNPESRPPSV